MCQACDFVGDSIQACVTGMEDCMRQLWPDEYPLPIFLTFAGLVSGVPAIFAVVYASNGDAGCETPLQTFLMIWAVCGLLNVLFAGYVYYMTLHPPPGMEESSILDRSWHLALYDPGVYCYLFVFAFQVILAMVASSWVADAACKDDNIYTMARAALLLLWVWVLGSVFILFLSLCFQCSRDDDVMEERRRRTREARSSTSARTAAAANNPHTSAPRSGRKSASRNNQRPGRYNPARASPGSRSRAVLSSSSDTTSDSGRSSGSASPPPYTPGGYAPNRASNPVSVVPGAPPSGYRQATYG